LTSQQPRTLPSADDVAPTISPLGATSGEYDAYPHGNKADNNGEYLSLFLFLVSESKNVKAIFECFVMGRDGEPSSEHSVRTSVLVYPPDGYSANRGWGLPQFVRRSDLERDYLTTDGFVTFMLGVIVLQQRDNDPIPVPASDIAGHLGRLLDCADGSDVVFSVSGEKFSAHKAVLAACSPVFKAQLFGSMAEAKMRCITLHDIKPKTFQVLLRFMYTDELPRDDEIQSSSNNIDLFQNLLVAADMYHLYRLKLMCARKLWDCVSAETVAEVLSCAEMYNCSELKSTCLDYFVLEENFKIAVLTDGYFQLMQSFPSVIDEIRARRRFDRQT
jgi:speckle-type POZ protein